MTGATVLSGNKYLLMTNITIATKRIAKKPIIKVEKVSINFFIYFYYLLPIMFTGIPFP